MERLESIWLTLKTEGVKKPWPGCTFAALFQFMVSLIWRGGSVFQLLALDRFGLRAHLCPTALDSNQSTEHLIIYHCHSTVNEKLFFWSWEKQFAQRGCGVSLAVDIPEPSGHSPVLWDSPVTHPGSFQPHPFYELTLKAVNNALQPQKSHFQSCQAHTSQNEIPDGFSANISEQSRQQVTIKMDILLARVNPCMDQHVGVTKIN